MKIHRKNSKPCNNSQGGLWNLVMDFHSPFSKSARSRRRGCSQLRGFTISIINQERPPQIIVIYATYTSARENQRVDRTHIDPSHNCLTLSVICTAYTTYMYSYLSRVHWQFLNNVWDNEISMFIEILNGITVNLGHLLFGSTIHPIDCFLVVQ